MHAALDYIALAIAMLPASGILAVMCYHAFPALRRWVDGCQARYRSFKSGMNRHFRNPSWHRLGRTAPTQTRI